MIVVAGSAEDSMTGIATAAKEQNKDIKIIGVQAEACPSAREALLQGYPFPVPAGKTIADGIPGSRDRSRHISSPSAVC